MMSVIIPLYNKEKTVANTIQTVLGQTFRDFEIVIVDDGSTDGSAGEVGKIDDSRIRLIRQQNAGVSAARNKGVEEAMGEYVAFLDADDEWKPDYLATQYALTQKYPDCGVFAVNYETRDAQGKTTPTIIRKLPFSGSDGILTNYFEVASHSNPPICSISVMVRKDAILSIGGFPVGIKSGEDLLTWARLACRYKIAYCRISLAIFNVEGYEVSEKPKRIPSDVDVVGNELAKLRQEYQPPHIDAYLSTWHKMRSSVYMRLRMRKRSIKEAIIGLRYDPLNAKLYAFIVLNLLPNKLQPF